MGSLAPWCCPGSIFRGCGCIHHRILVYECPGLGPNVLREPEDAGLERRQVEVTWRSPPREHSGCWPYHANQFIISRFSLPRPSFRVMKMFSLMNEGRMLPVIIAYIYLLFPAWMLNSFEKIMVQIWCIFMHLINFGNLSRASLLKQLFLPNNFIERFSGIKNVE